MGPIGGGQRLLATGRRGPHSKRHWEPGLQSLEASGDCWPGFLCSWVLLHMQSPVRMTSHNWVHLPRPRSRDVGQCRSGGGQGAKNSLGEVTLPGSGVRAPWLSAHSAQGWAGPPHVVIQPHPLCTGPTSYPPTWLAGRPPTHLPTRPADRYSHMRLGSVLEQS